MEDYKYAALNRFFEDKQLTHRFASSSQIPYKLLMIGEIPIYARLANNSESVARGLMGVEKLASNEGCLLCFQYDVPANLWMKNCKINLQAATIDNSGTIIDILDMYYEDPYRAHRSTKPVRYALEMPEHFFTKHSIKPGDKVRLL